MKLPKNKANSPHYRNFCKYFILCNYSKEEIIKELRALITNDDYYLGLLARPSEFLVDVYLNIKK